MHLLYFEFPDWISPTIIPGLPFQWYGLMYLVAFGLTWFLTRYQVREQGLEITDDQLIDFFFWGIVGLLIGARLFATLIFNETGYYFRNPLRIFWPFDEAGNFTGLQGMNYYGGLLGAVIGFWGYARVKKLDLLRLGDMIVAAVPLGYTFGRLGNFINGELFGRVTTAAWGVVFPNAQSFPASESWVQEVMTTIGMDPAGAGVGTVGAGAASTATDVPEILVNLPRHPTQLYEGFTEGILAWFVIWFFIRKRVPFRGFIVGFYVLWYGAWRFLIDYFRMPLGSDYWLRLAGDASIPPYRLLTPWNFIASQFWSGIMVLAGIALIIGFRRWDRYQTERIASQIHAKTESNSAASRRKKRAAVEKTIKKKR